MPSILREEFDKEVHWLLPWLKLALEHDARNFLPLAGKVVSNNGISIVVRASDQDGVRSGIYKRSIPFLIENELWCLQELALSGFVPRAVRYDKYTILMEDLGLSQPVTDSVELWRNFDRLATVLHNARIRHGDLTTQAVIVRENFPYLIDFAESRRWHDPRPDKRPEGDKFWINKTYGELTRRTQ